MNKTQAKAAAKKYKDVAATPEELKGILAADSITDTDADLIISTVFPPVKEKQNVVYEEWRIEKTITKDKKGETVINFSKLKRIREGVTITQDEADNWNRGNAAASSHNPVFYLLPDQDVNDYVAELLEAE